MLGEEHSGGGGSQCKGPEVGMSDMNRGNLRKASGSEEVGLDSGGCEAREVTEALGTWWGSQILF